MIDIGGLQSRLGGTSAAAPLVVRFLANSLTLSPAADGGVAEETEAPLARAPPSAGWRPPSFFAEAA